MDEHTLIFMHVLYFPLCIFVDLCVMCAYYYAKKNNLRKFSIKL